jgi:N-acyl homoserine lactone hydrolase
MTNLRSSLLAAGSLALSLSAAACAPTTHAVAPSTIGVPRSTADLAAVVDEPGPVTVETVVGADWQVDRSGLINLNHDKAVAAGLKDGPEPVIVPFHAIHHPTEGLYLVDTGVEKALRDAPEKAAVKGMLASFMHIDKMVFHTDTAAWIGRQKEPVRGVFLTHLHVDHISGMRDVPSSAIVYTGPGEATEKAFLHMFVRGVTDDALDGKGPVREWRFQPDPSGAFQGVIDVFGDRTVWALSVPGHTPGSTAYLARTPNGPVLMVGDACHTAWGWQHGVEPGTFSDDQKKSADSLARLERFVARHPRIDVRLGHQMLPQKPAAPTATARQP